MQQRYYDPAIGRFMSVDPVTTNPDTGAGFNRYAYAANNPHKYVDPDGRKEIDCRGSNTCASEIKIKDLDWGDRVLTDGATVQIARKSGDVTVEFNQGYEDGASAAMTGPRITPTGPARANVASNISRMQRVAPNKIYFFAKVKPRGELGLQAG